MVVTCHKDTSVGTKLLYDRNGKITSKTPCARQVGGGTDPTDIV